EILRTIDAHLLEKGLQASTSQPTQSGQPNITAPIRREPIRAPEPIRAAEPVLTAEPVRTAEPSQGGVKTPVATVKETVVAAPVNTQSDEELSPDDLLYRERIRRAEENERARIRRELEKQKIEQYLQQQQRRQ